MADHPNILLVVVDCLRSDRAPPTEKGKEVMPFLSELAEKGRSFEDVYSTGSWTVPAHGSLFTGTLPSEHGAYIGQPVLTGDTGPVLSEVLSSAGYETVGISANPWLSDEFGFTRRFDEFQEVLPTLPFEDGGDPRILTWKGQDSTLSTLTKTLSWVFQGNPLKRTVNRFSFFGSSYPLAPGTEMNEHVRSWLADRDDDDTPFFMFTNYMDVHEPYQRERLESFLDRDIHPNGFEDVWNLPSLLNPDIVKEEEDIRRVYDASVSLADDRIESLIDIFDQNNILEDTIVIITSDHGQALGENGFWGHGYFLSDALVKVPLVVYSQDKALLPAREDNRPLSVAELYDYIETIATVDGDAEPPADFPNRPASDGLVPICQSFGVRDNEREDVVSKGIDVPLDGCETAYFGGWVGSYDCKEQVLQVEVSGGTQSVSREEARETLEENMTFAPCQKSSEQDSIQIDTDTKRRLKQLGYR
ncbi:sulfatase [Halorhabdus sp. CUG00001]|uniref:sulfatase n=1 Tax=Halorhabdus sp. CUG00001 TaxID=2600297 RepID=UPI00131D34EB|nr:sulfatase [Halorhabdus sp. CUG00001]